MILCDTPKVYDEAVLLEIEQGRLERLKEKTESWIDEICEVCGAQKSPSNGPAMAKQLPSNDQAIAKQ